MGPSPRPDAANSRRSGVRKCTPQAYSNNGYPYIPATPPPSDCLRSHPSRHNYSVAQESHPVHQLPKFASTRLAQPQYDAVHRSHYRYTPASQLENHTAEQEWDAHIFISGRDQRKRQTLDHERPTPVNIARASSPTKSAVAMLFVPEQPAKRAMMFETSLFQRNDPSTTPLPSYEPMPLSELNISPNISLGQYNHTQTLRKHAPEPSRRSCVNPTPRSSSHVPPHGNSRRDSMRCARPYHYEDENEVFTNAPPKGRRLARAIAPHTRSNTKTLRPPQGSIPPLRA